MWDMALGNARDWLGLDWDEREGGNEGLWLAGSSFNYRL